MVCVAGCGGSVHIVDGDAPTSARSALPGAGPSARPNSGTTGPAGAAAAQSELCQTRQPLPASPARRLSHVEYNRTVRALFPGLTLPKQEFAADLRVHGFENNALALNASPALLEQYSAAASRIAELAAAEPQRLMPCMARADMACAKQFVAQFGRRAFRRTLSPDEQARYEGLFAGFVPELGYAAAFELTLDAFLQSPQFLYRLELATELQAKDAPPALDGFAMASRLSYFLWQSMPDDELLDAAEADALRTPDQVAAQARRMLEAPQAKDAFVDFHRQWLGFDRVLDENKDPALFPAWSDALRASIREESDRVVAHVFGSDAPTLAELLTTRVTFADTALAQLYEVPLQGAAWETPLMLPADKRAGLLTRANFLAGRAHTTNGSPPLRGVAVLGQLLCAPPAAPPANAAATPPVADMAAKQTNRQLFEEKTRAAECQACHKTINGVGYGFEHYDSTGQFRARDNGSAVDASGELIGTDVDGPFRGAVELSERLASSRTVQRCAAQNWLRYAFGRDDNPADTCLAEQLAESMAASNGDLRELLVLIATSAPFMSQQR